jgi:ubiquinone/menaquinone biosynthesis C-methylase UbiE
MPGNPSDPESSTAGLPEYAALLAARHAAHRPELYGLLKDLWGGRKLDVLDVACGDGFYAAGFDAVLAPGATVTAVDLSDAFLRWAAECVAAERGPAHRVEFVQADAERLPFPDARFDLVWCAQSLISLPDPLAALREMRRVVRPGGTVGILENDRFHEMQMPWPPDLELALREAQEAAGASDGEGDKPHAGRFLEDLFRDAGLSPTRRITCAIDRQAPLGPADKAFVQCYLSELLRRTAARLPADRRAELRRLADPVSGEYLPARETFWMTWTDAVVLASRECGR